MLYIRYRDMETYNTMIDIINSLIDYNQYKMIYTYTYIYTRIYTDFFKKKMKIS